MVIIADSSALISLAVCNKLELIEKLFDNIYVPQAVYEEIDVKNKPEANKLKVFLKNKVQKIDLSNYIISSLKLGIGELEAMALYKKLNADFLLTDDKQARKIAEYNNIKIIGSIGVLISAKKHGYINEIKTSLDSINNSYIYLSKELYQHALRITNED